MRSYVTSAILAAALVLAPMAAGYAPASAQDFSITNDVRVEGAVLGPDWIRKLQAWWDAHGYYPRDAAEKNEAGTVRMHMIIHPDGLVYLIKAVQGSGSHALDNAAFWTFHNMHLQPFPPGTPAPQADITISLHYVLGHQPSKRPFTVTNEPRADTVVATTLQRTCSGTVTLDGPGRTSWLGMHNRVAAIFYRKPDGTPWVKWIGQGGAVGFAPVTELGRSAEWVAQYNLTIGRPHYKYAVWPDGDNALSGTVNNGWPLGGTVELTCDTEIVPQITSDALMETR